MKIKEKAKLYFLSLTILFPIILIMSLKMPEDDFLGCPASGCDKMTVLDVIGSNVWLMYKANWLPILMLICFFFSMFIKRQFDYLLDGSACKSIRVRSAKSEDYEHLTFLATYIIPFFGFSFDDPRKLLAYLILLVVIGMIFIKTDKYYANPTLALLGYRLYRVDLSDSQGLYESVIVISQDQIQANQSIRYKLISENVFFAKVLK
ncbi:conserved membrane hypothetical protein [Vibrio chagasii]|nr:conserved membrane hypothetical protein [Vibrio chagasii]